MGAKRKEKIRAILAARDFVALDKWVKKRRSPLRMLFSLTYDSDALIRYRAIEAIGKTATFIASYDMEQVRNFVRSLIWMMTEESGGIGWYAPEAMAEICVRVDTIFDELAKLIPQFLNEESFIPSTCAALHRLAPKSKKLIADNADLLKPLLNNKRRVELYDFDTGAFVEISVGKLVSIMIEST
jgi:hypothetical protein